jgi:signal peptidase II
MPVYDPDRKEMPIIEKKEKSIVSAKRARLYDVFALLTVMIVIALDQWTKRLVVHNLNLGSEVPFPLVGHYLVLAYTQNNGAAFSIFRDNWILVLLIGVAIIVVASLYLRILNSGSLILKLVFGLIIGGAFGNLIDRLLHSGYVVDFVSFRIPEIEYKFAIFNVADACISVGVFLLLAIVLLGGWDRKTTSARESDTTPTSTTTVQQEDVSEKRA